MADLKSMYKKAEEALNKHNYDYARDAYLHIISISPNEAEAHKLLYETTIRKFKELGPPSKITQKFMIGKTTATLAVQRNPQSRMETAQKHLLDDPDNSSVRVQYASALMELGHPAGALAQAEIAVRANQNNAEAYKILGRTLLAAGRTQEAQGAFSRAKSLKPNDPEIEKLSKDAAAEATMKKGFESADYRLAMKDVDLAQQLEKRSQMLKTDEDVVEFIKDLNAELQKSPNDAKFLVKLGEVYSERRKEYKTAQEWFKKAVAAAPHDSALKDRVEDMDIRLMDQGIAQAKASKDEARLKQLQGDKLLYEVRVYERRANDRPTDPLAHFELGRRYLQAGQVDKAIPEFQYAVKDPKRKVNSHLYMGLCFHRKKQYELADKNYRSADEAAFADEVKMEIWYRWGVCLEESAQPARAAELYTRICQIDFNYKSGEVAQRLDKLKGTAAS